MLYSSLSSPLPSCNAVLRNKRPLTLLHSEKTFATHYKKKGIMHDDMIDFFAHAPTRHEPRRKTGTFQGAAFTGFVPQSSIWGAQFEREIGKEEKRGSARFGSIWMSEQIGTAPAAALECSADPPPLYVHRRRLQCAPCTHPKVPVTDASAKLATRDLKANRKCTWLKKIRRQTLYSLNSYSTVGKTARRKTPEGALTADPPRELI
ncbi:unnamed protein product [Ixodes pacificus]